MIFVINTTSDISKLLYVISRAVRWVKFETILKYHKWYLCQMSRTNHAIICLYYYPQKVVIFTCRYFKLSWNTTALSQSNCRNISCSSISNHIAVFAASEAWREASVGGVGGTLVPLVGSYSCRHTCHVLLQTWYKVSSQFWCLVISIAKSSEACSLQEFCHWLTDSLSGG